MDNYYDENVDQFVANIICIGIVGVLVSAVGCAACPAEGLIAVGVATLVGGMSLAIKTGQPAYIVIGTGGLIWISVGQRRIERRNAERLTTDETFAVTALSNDVAIIGSVAVSSEIDTVPNESDTVFDDHDQVSIENGLGNDDSDEIVTRDDQLTGKIEIAFHTGDAEGTQQVYDNSDGSDTIDSQHALESGLQLSEVYRQDHTEINSLDVRKGESASRISTVIAAVVGSDPVIKARSILNRQNKTQNNWHSGEYEIVSENGCNGKEDWDQAETDIDSQGALERGLELSYTDRQKYNASHTLCNLQEADVSVAAAEDRDPDNSLKRDTTSSQKPNKEVGDNQRDIIESSESSKPTLENIDHIGVDRQE